MKTWLKVLLGLMSVAAVIVMLVLKLTSGMVESADAFFTAVKQKDLTTARTYLAEDFKKSTDEKALSEFLSNSAILNFKEASWTNRQVDNGRGELEGSITTESGGVVPIKISFVKENDEWKIYAMQKPEAGLSTASSDKTPSTTATNLPEPAMQLAMARQAMHDFLVSVKAKDMSHFHSTLSNLWQQQYSVEKLNEAYKPIIDNKADWSVLENVIPTVSVKTYDNGMLILAGSYPTKPSRVDFEQGYIYQNNTWKLLSFSIEAKAENQSQ